MTHRWEKFGTGIKLIISHVNAIFFELNRPNTLSSVLLIIRNLLVGHNEHKLWSGSAFLVSMNGYFGTNLFGNPTQYKHQKMFFQVNIG